MRDSSALLKIRANPDRVIGLTIFILACALYARTTAPALGGGFDSEEFQHAAYTLSVAHSTGYPLYLILGKIFTTLVPIGNIAYRMNLLSAILSAGAATLVYLNAMQLTQSRMASIAAAAIFATNSAIWRQAGVASVGPLNLLLLAAIMYALLLWRAHRAPIEPAAFLFGLSLTHHRSALFLLPAIILFILLDDPGILTRTRDLARALLAFTLPLLLYLYIPIVGSGTPWYTNTLEGFINQISGNEAGNYIRNTPFDLAQAIVLIIQYLHDSFDYIGPLLIIIGAVSVVPRWNHWETPLDDSRVTLFSGLAVLTYVGFATLVEGEHDRYFSLIFFLLIFWLAIGVGGVENFFERQLKSTWMQASARGALYAALLLMMMLPLGDRYRLADWSSFDRVYKQWDEIFSLPIPRNATLVGNWPQLNAMRYMQRVENRRADLRFVGAAYDPTPQIEAARDAFADHRSIFLAPGIDPLTGSFRYALLGSLLEVRDAPRMQPPDSIPIPKNIAINPSLTLVGLGVSNALEPYKQTESIAPGRTVRVALDWRAEGSVKDFLVRIRLYDPEARLISQKDEAPVRGLYPASQWQRGEYVNDVHNFLIPAGTPPGEYKLEMAPLDAETKSQSAGEIDLASLTVERATNLSRDQIFVQHSLDIRLDHRLSLWGYGGFEGTHRAGETIVFNLLWAVGENIGEEVMGDFALIDRSGNIVKEWQRTPIAYYPTREWQKGELLKAYYDLQLPNNLQPDELSLAIALISKEKPTSLTPIARIQVVP